MQSLNTQAISVAHKSKLNKAQARKLKMPKRNRSAYFLFSMDTRAQLKNEFGHTLTPLETQAKVSQYWKDLSAEEKEKYEVRAKEEKMEYLTAMEKFYAGLTPETLAKSKVNRPKKPCSAYAHFVRDVKTSLKKENPRLIMQEILHIVSDKWKNLDESIRAKYEEKARIDKEKYMAVIKKLNPLSRHESQKPKIQINENLGKRVMEMTDSSERSPVKQVKLESMTTKTESREQVQQTTYRLVKIEESNTTSSPRSAPANEEITVKFEGLEMPGLNPNVMRNIPTLIQNPMNPMIGNYDKMKEMMLARLSWQTLVQTNSNIEQAIARRMAEVKALQAQQFLFAQRAFIAANTGAY